MRDCRECLGKIANVREDETYTSAAQLNLRRCDNAEVERPLITPATLKSYTLKDLASLARKSGVAGWQTMRKEQLVKALARVHKTKKPAAPTKASRPVSKSKPAAKATAKPNGAAKVATNGAIKSNLNGAAKASPAKASAPPSKPVAPRIPEPVVPPKLTGAAAARATRITRQIQKLNVQRDQHRDLARDANGNGKDRLVLMVRDAYWLHACWEVSRQSVERARAAMAEHWHTAKPTLRVMEVETGTTTSTAERMMRDIAVHGGVKNWYIDVNDPPKSYRVDLGYLAANGKFFVIGRSNVVTTPQPGSSDAIDENWTDIAENYEKIYAQSGGSTEGEGCTGELQELFEERLRRPMGAPLVTRYGVGAERMLGRAQDFQFDVDAEMIIYGTTHPDAHVQLSGEPVKVREDGSFTVRMSMPDRRQVIPIVAASNDGIEQRTIVLAVERNTKVMEPMIREANE